MGISSHFWSAGKDYNMQDTVISVIVPIYKVAEYLQECIESILQQTYKNLEIILVDDGSPDESGDICDSYAKEDSRIKVIHKKNGGLVSSRKAGCEIATGQYITFVDGDDKIAPNMYEEMLSWAGEDTDIIISDFYAWKEGNVEPINQHIKEGVYTGNCLNAELKSHALCYNEYFSFGILPSVCNKLYRRELYIPIQMRVPDRICLGEDASCTYPCIMRAQKVIYKKVPFYYYRVRETSMTRTWKKGKSEELLALIEWLKLDAVNFPDTNMQQQVLLYSCSLLDDYVTGNINNKIPLRQIKDEYRTLSGHGIVKEIAEYIQTSRTSSRSKRVIKYLNNCRLMDYIELWLFIKWEKHH